MSSNQQENCNSFHSAKISLNDSKILVSKLNNLKHQMQSSLNSKTKQLSLCNKQRQNQNKYKYISIKEKAEKKKNQAELKSKIQQVRQNVIGFNTQYISPFNIQLESVYVDHTATNRPYRAIEDLVEYAKRFSANPHTEFSHYGKYSTEMMHYSHLSLLKSFSANPQLYMALPTGSGCTGAIEKAIRMLKTFEDPNNKPDIFMTPYQHHSNILPWIEFYDKIQLLQHSETGQLELDKIYEQIKNWKANDLIVSVSATSNVTSQLTDLKGLNQVIKKLRKHKHIVFAVDCAAFCCHHELNLKIYDQIDFAFLSPHKNLGGAETCGILILKKAIIKGDKPTFPGGGTVQFVKGYNKQDVLYDTDIFNRQVAGTPPFLGYYRAALSFELMNSIGYELINQRQKLNTEIFTKIIYQENEKFLQEGIATNIVMYGSQDWNQRANVISLNMICDNEVMQHSFLSLILADTFGIQLRSGCFCAGPFGMQLLKVDQKTAERLSSIVSLGILKEKPGYLRLDLTFYLEDYEIEYIARAMVLTARYCKNMLLVYTICNDGQIKRHKLFKDTFLGLFSLENHFYARQSRNKDDESDETRLSKRRKTLEDQLKQGQQILEDPLKFLRVQIHKDTLKKD